MTGPRETAAHRAALDHVLDLTMALPWSHMLVLRGSRLMRSWYGDLAREPADLDFVVLPDLSVPIDPGNPYPYVSGFDIVQQWPEFAGGAGRYRIWTDGEEEFDTNGIRVIVPPEGLRWVMEPREDNSSRDISDLFSDLADQAKKQPAAAAGVWLEPDGVSTDCTWAYSYGGDEAGGIRVIVPWSAPGLAAGQVQVDFALDERLPEPPAWTRIPLAPDATRQLVVPAATRGLSLAWKLLWLHADSAADNGPFPKDLYDAVILAEDTRTQLSPRLLRRVMSQSAAGTPAGEAGARNSPPASADWLAFLAGIPGTTGSAEDWLTRLNSALASHGLGTQPMK